MRIDRRKALALLGLGAASPAAAQMPKPLGVSFQHGVASGDPTQDRLVLWTRITPETPHGQIAYKWTLNPLDRRAGGAKHGSDVTGPERDYTVKVDVAGLDPGRAYTFSFTSEGVTSPAGRTRTLPAGPTKDAVIAVVSCALYPNGYFNAYQAIAQLDRIDVVLHLGDYIYEYGGPLGYGSDSAVAAERPHDPPHECVSLADYRLRHAQYKRDPSLQAAHERAPWIVAWDDHETANDSYKDGAENHQPATEGDWSTRKAVALKAYYEWMPIREPAAGQTLAEAGARSFRIGDLAQLVMLETRLTARDKQLVYDRDLIVDGKPDVAAFKAKFTDPTRRMMGPAQEAWLEGELASSVKAGHTWQVVGSGVVMGRLRMPQIGRDLSAADIAGVSEQARKRIERWQPIAQLGLPYGLDMWDGYPIDRERVYDLVRQAGARPIVVSGDSHAFWANELADAGGKRVAVEFGGTSVTSPGADDGLKMKIGPAFAAASPEVVFSDQGAKGFVLLTLTHTEARGDLMAVSSIVSKTFTTRAVKSFRVVPEGSGLSALKEI
ncbi:alkaline phosphatase D family protein [Phenylobacterium sp.]|uniref:alkaline phosphatase D family protein n=1 Tax=Phenylobacterium sp. TaxID=1871053 RepID=UPI0025F40B4F|nr:alkaline phosphatase D family protein [Phenylobacterium sp.]